MMSAKIHLPKFSIFGKLYFKFWHLPLFCMTFPTKMQLRVHLIKLQLRFCRVFQTM